MGILDNLNVESSGYYQKAKSETDKSSLVDSDRSNRFVSNLYKIGTTADMFDGLLSNTVSMARFTTKSDYCPRQRHARQRLVRRRTQLLRLSGCPEAG